MEEGRKDCRGEREGRTPGEHGPLNQISRTHMDSETEEASTEPVWSVPCPLHMCYGC